MGVLFLLAVILMCSGLTLIAARVVRKTENVMPFLLLYATLSAGWIVLASKGASMEVGSLMLLFPSGAPFLALTYLVLGLVSERFGKSESVRLFTLMVLGQLLLILILVAGTVISPYAAGFMIPDEIVPYPDPLPLLAALVTSIAGQGASAWLYATLRNRTQGRLLWIRQLFSGLPAALGAAFVFVGVLRAGAEVDVAGILAGFMTVQWLVVLLSLPVAYFCRTALDRSVGRRKGSLNTSRWFRIRKDLYQRFNLNGGKGRMIAITIGCQRSGTTLLSSIFERDMRTRVYREKSRLTVVDDIEDRTIRLKPLPEVERILMADRAPIIVFKPLMQTQQANDILDHFPEARALWMYRHYKDSASSITGNKGMRAGINNIRPIAEGKPGNWRGEGLSEDVRSVIRSHFSSEMNPYDAAALFWYARNSFFFDHNLIAHPRVMLFNYESLVSNPDRMMDKIYGFLGQPFPGSSITSHVFTASVGKGKNITLSPDIDALCNGMLKRFDEEFVRRPYFDPAVTRTSSGG